MKNVTVHNFFHKPVRKTRDAGQKVSFEEWMRRVDAAVEARAGLSVHDLEDAPFRDWYDAGVSATSAAGRTIRQSRGDAARDAAFAKGDKVVAKRNAQGMVKGKTYTVTGFEEIRTPFTVTGFEEIRTPFGAFVIYELDGKLNIRNGLELLEKVG